VRVIPGELQRVLWGVTVRRELSDYEFSFNTSQYTYNNSEKSDMAVAESAVIELAE
jgi:hypothetical protein